MPVNIKSTIQEVITSYHGFTTKTWINILVILVNSLGNMATLFMALYLVTRLSFSALNASHIVAIFSVGIVIGAYLGGLLCEYFQSYKLTITALLASGISILLFPFFKTYGSLFMLAFCMGAWYGIFKPANLITLLADYREKDQAKIMSLYRVAVNLGNGLATALGGLLASINYHWVFWFDGFTSIVAGFVLIHFKGLFNNLSTPIKTPTTKGKLTIILSNKIFMLACLILFLSSLIFYQIQFGYPLYLHQYYQLSAKQFGYLFFLNCILIVLLQVPILHILRNVNQIVLAAIGMGLITLGFFILPFGNAKWFATVSCVIWTFGEMVMYPILFNLAMDAIQPEVKSRSIGIYQTIYTSAAVLAPIIGGVFYPIYNGNLLWYVCGLWGVMSLLIYWQIDKTITRS